MVRFLMGRQTPMAVIGGLSMAAYGMPRTTLDLDIVVPASVQDELVSFLEAMGYETLHVSSGYSNHVHDDDDLGRVDVVYVRGETADALFEDVRMVPGPGSCEVPVLRPEHLAAMKAFAMKNDPSRTFRELADIQFLLTLPGVDRGAIEERFRRYGLEGRFEEINRLLDQDA